MKISNKNQYIFSSLLITVSSLFLMGTLFQTFMLESGFSENQVYLYTTITNGVQVAVIFLSMLFLDKITNAKIISVIYGIGYALLAFTLLFISINRANVTFNTYLLFGSSIILYLIIGVGQVNQSRLPYQVINIKEYGKISSTSLAISGVVSFLITLLFSFFISKIEYFTVINVTFIICIFFALLGAFLIITLKNVDGYKEKIPQKNQKLQIFKNKNMYALLIPNFLRGIAAGILSLLTVIGYSKGLLNAESSSWLNIELRIALLLGNVAFIFFSKRFTTATLMIISSTLIAVFLPFIIMGNTFCFVVLFFIVQFFLMIENTSVPVMVTEIVPFDQVGAFSSIRLSVFTFGQMIASMIMNSLINGVGYLGVLIIGGVCQILCAIGYAVVVNKEYAKKRQDLMVDENGSL